MNDDKTCCKVFSVGCLPLVVMAFNVIVSDRGHVYCGHLTSCRSSTCCVGAKCHVTSSEFLVSRRND